MIALGLAIVWQIQSSCMHQIEPIVALFNCLATKVQLKIKGNQGKWDTRNIGPCLPILDNLVNLMSVAKEVLATKMVLTVLVA